jgi:hypothetical protein
MVLVKNAAVGDTGDVSEDWESFNVELRKTLEILADSCWNS